MVTGLSAPAAPRLPLPEAPATRPAPRSLTLGVTATGIASFCMLYAPQPVLPEIARTFQLSPGSASLAVTVASAGLTVSVLPLATLSEVVGRRRVIVWSLVLSVILGLLVPFAPTFDALLVVRGLQGAAIAGFPGVAAAFLVERLGAGGVAGVIGAMVAGNVVGGLLGRLTAGFTTALGWQVALLACSGVATACAAVALVALRERRVPTVLAPVVRPGPRGLLLGLRAAVRSPLLLAQYGTALLGMGAFVAMYNAAAFRLTGPPIDLAPAAASLIFLAYAVGAVASAFAGRLIDRFGRRAALAGSLAVAIAGTTLTASDRLGLIAAGFVIFTSGFFAAHAVSSGWTAFAADPGGRGQASGLYTLAYYLGGSVGGTAGTVLYAVAGWGALVIVVAAALGLAMVVVLAVSGWTNRVNPRARPPG